MKTISSHLKLVELSSLFIVYNITIFKLYPLHSFLFYFLLRDSAHTLYDCKLFFRLDGTCNSMVELSNSTD